MIKVGTRGPSGYSSTFVPTGSFPTMSEDFDSCKLRHRVTVYVPVKGGIQS